MSTEIQTAKTLVLNFQKALDSATDIASTTTACQQHLSSGHIYRGVHPFNEISSTSELAQTVWAPVKTALPVLQRRPDIFFAGHHHMNEGNALWVVSMGHFIGDWTNSWLGMAASLKLTFIPYVAWYRIVGNEIVETVEWLDILSVITQAGLNPYAPEQTAAHIMSPGPLTHDGLLYGSADTKSSAETFDIAHAMLTELAETMTSPKDHLERFWHADMTWFGPTGIGACLGFHGYHRGHTGPFEARQDFVAYHAESAATAEGSYAAFLWRPGLDMRNTGNYLGVPANNALAEMRIVDVYRHAEGKLAENWIFIDILHFMKMQGIDLLADIGAQK